MRDCWVRYKTGESWVISPVVDAVHVPVPARAGIVGAADQAVGVGLASVLIVARPNCGRIELCAVPMKEVELVGVIREAGSGESVVVLGGEG